MSIFYIFATITYYMIMALVISIAFVHQDELIEFEKRFCKQVKKYFKTKFPIVFAKAWVRVLYLVNRIYQTFTKPFKKRKDILYKRCRFSKKIMLRQQHALRVIWAETKQNY